MYGEYRYHLQHTLSFFVKKEMLKIFHWQRVMREGSVTFKYGTDNNIFQLTVKKINELPVKVGIVNLFKR